MSAGQQTQNGKARTASTLSGTELQIDTGFHVYRSSPHLEFSPELEKLHDQLTNQGHELEFKSLLLDQANDSIVAHDLDGHLVYVNETAAARMGFSREELIGQHLPALLAIPLDLFAQRVQHILAEGQATFESGDLFPDGTTHTVEVSSRVLSYGERTLICSVSRDISERKQAEVTIERLAYHDPLTGLANRRLFDDRLHMACAHSRRTKEPLALYYLDIDDFKAINDSLGHSVGDVILCRVAERLQLLVREADSVGRLGGDEFGLLLLDTTTEDALSLAERLLAAVRVPIFLADRRLDLTVSLGIGTSHGGRESAEALLQQGDLAMYAAKSEGGNCYRLHDDDLANAALARFRLRTELAEAFEQEQFRLFYQPLVRLSTREVVGAEALLRWRHPTLGEVSPDEFIPLAEESGLIIPLGAWVLERACRQAQVWRAAGLPLEHMAVNVSGRQLLQGDSVADVRSALAVSGLPAQCLELEITEGVALAPSPQVVEVLVALRRLGVSLAIDDFGAGHSSFTRLKDLPIQTLKVDRSFIDGLHEATDETRAIVQTIIRLATCLGLETVAEGVENDQQRQLLTAMGCGRAQGFLFSRPVPANDFARFCAEMGGDDRAQTPAKRAKTR